MSTDIIEKTCPKCGAKVRIKVTYGVWPMRCEETVECPVCDTLLHKANITGDMEVTLLTSV